MAFFLAYKKTLETDLVSDTSGHFRRLMVSLCNAHRDESGFTDLFAAIADAQAMFEAGEAMWGTDESVFNSILCQRNFQQLRLVIQQYKNYSGNSLEKAIKNEFSGDIKARCQLRMPYYKK
jgi:annexin A7/11